MKKRKGVKGIWIFLDGEPLCDAVLAALDNHMFIGDLVEMIKEENPGHVVEAKVV